MGLEQPTPVVVFSLGTLFVCGKGGWPSTWLIVMDELSMAVGYFELLILSYTRIFQIKGCLNASLNVCKCDVTRLSVIIWPAMDWKPVQGVTGPSAHCMLG